MKYTVNTKKLKGGQLNLPCGNITQNVMNTELIQGLVREGSPDS